MILKDFYHVEAVFSGLKAHPGDGRFGSHRIYVIGLIDVAQEGHIEGD